MLSEFNFRLEHELLSTRKAVNVEPGLTLVKLEEMDRELFCCLSSTLPYVSLLSYGFVKTIELIIGALEQENNPKIIKRSKNILINSEKFDIF